MNFTFKLKTDPGAVKGDVAGNFTDWKPVEMTKVGNGKFELVVPLGVGKYQFKFIVDGEWKHNMNDGYETVRNPYGNADYVIEITSL